MTDDLAARAQEAIERATREMHEIKRRYEEGV